MSQTIPIAVYGDVDPRAVEQLRRCAEAGDAYRAALCADGHVGYSQPIGGVVAYKDYISPSGVGYDIACGNKAVATNLFYGDIKDDLPKIMDEVFRRISFGIGRVNNEPLDHPVFDRIAHDAPMPAIAKMLPKARKQLGTVGSGNHYVDLFREEGTDRIWIGVHFGSRGFGHAIASGFLALSQGLGFEDRATEGEMDSPPTLLHVDSALAHNYIEAMELAGEYAYAGRDVVCDKVMEILGAEPFKEIHNHHNFAWREEHGGEEFWVIRKGCTPAFPHQEGFVGATMGEASVILTGVESSSGAELLYSTVHGAGRLMSRTRAAGKRRKRWACNNRACDWVQGTGEHRPEGDVCPACGHDKLSRRLVEISKGEIDWEETTSGLIAQGVELRGGGADEAPGAYKRLDEVLDFHGDSVEVLHRLIPIGVAMAGADTPDPYKD